jgi:hypothetical protein
MFSRAKEQCFADMLPARYAFERDWIGNGETLTKPKPKKSHLLQVAVQQTGRQESARTEYGHSREYSYIQDNFVSCMSIYHCSSAATFTEVPLRKMTLMSRYRWSVGNLALMQDGGKVVRMDDAHD